MNKKNNAARFQLPPFSNVVPVPLSKLAFAVRKQLITDVRARATREANAIVRSPKPELTKLHIDQLREMNPQQRKAFLEGDWEANQ